LEMFQFARRTKMKKAIYWMTISATAALLSTQADEAKLKAKAGDAEIKVEADADVDRDKDARVKAKADLDKRKNLEARAEANAVTDERAVKKSNKASGLLGMEVRNQSNDKLGEIKDLVMNLNSGKVSYAVLAAGGFLGVGEKLLAVPVSAFKLAEDETHLVLNADRAKIQASVGFPATNWPDPNDQKTTGYWLTGDAAGSAPQVEVERSNRRVDVDVDRNVKRDRKLEVNVDDDKNDKLHTETKVNDRNAKAKADVDVDVDRRRNSVTARADADLDTRNPNWKSVEGEVRSVDVERNTMTIQTKAGKTHTVYMDKQTAMRLNREQVVRLNDYKPGYAVRVDYEEQGGRVMGRRIIKADITD
jgi:sporulation protein YlmC with PRC-barrel domain